MVSKFINKQVVIEAMEFTTDSDDLIGLQSWMDEVITIDFAVKDDPKLKLPSPDGSVIEVPVGDYIVKGDNGEFYAYSREVFNMTYSPIGYGLTFGMAIEELKKGNKVARQGWNGKGMFVFMQVPTTINKSIVPNMQSLPQSVKDEFGKRFNDPNEQIDAIYYSNQLAIVNPSNAINGWAPSVSDALANDWYVVL